MITGIHHVTLAVRNLAAAVDYYSHVVGLEPVTVPDTGWPAQVELDEPGLPKGRQERCLLAGRNGYLELVSLPEPGFDIDQAADPVNRPGIRHFCIQNHDIAILEAAVLGHGGSLIAPPLDLGTGNQYAYSRDPEGNIMEIEGLPHAPPAEPTWMAHVALVTCDMDAAVAFYGQFLGRPLQNRGRFGPADRFDRMGGLQDAELEGAWISAGNMLLELWQFHAPDYRGRPKAAPFSEPGYSHFCLVTDQLEADAARIVELGGSLISAVDAGDAGRRQFAGDPEGNVLELLELRSPDGPFSLATLADPGICARIDAAR